MAQPTSGKQWRAPREQGELVRLGSGYVARLRPVDVGALLASGTMPDILTPLAARIVYEGADAQEQIDAALLQQSVEMLEMFNVVCKAAFLEPRIVDNPQADDEISIEDLSYVDRAQVFNVCIQPAEVLRTFRLQQESDVATVPDGQGDGHAAE